MKVLAVLGVLSVLPACAIVQGAYDERVKEECNELPTSDERRDCNRAAEDAEQARRQSL